MERKDFLKAFVTAAAAGPILIDACKKDSTTSAATSSTTTTATTTTTSTTTDSNTGCSVTPTETEGPYPYVGGEATNPLNRSDITGGMTGIPLTLNIIVTNTNSNCAVVSNARVDIWHCNKDGYYSGYASQPGYLGTESYVGLTWLRGYQTTDTNGTAKFTSIYPGWYTGRATHIHFEIYVNSVLKNTTQICFPDATNTTVYASSLYSAHGANPIINTADSIFGDSATDLAKELITLSGSVTDGYTGTVTIGLAL